MSGIDNADADFTDSIVLSAVEKCGLWTMLDSYLQLLDYEEYNTSKYKDNAAMAVAGKSIDTREKLVRELSEAMNKAKNNTSGTGGGTAAGGADAAERHVSVPCLLYTSCC